MTAKERILLIRLTEKLVRQPEYAKALGLEAGSAGRKQKTEQKSLTNA